MIPERGISVNVGQIDGGIRPNVVAPFSKAIVDVRVPTAADGLRIEAAIHRLQPTIPGTRITVEGSMDVPPMEATPRNRRLWNAAREAGRRLGIELEEGVAGGVSDGNTASQYTATLDGLGAVGDGRPRGPRVPGLPQDDRTMRPGGTATHTSPPSQSLLDDRGGRGFGGAGRAFSGLRSLIWNRARLDLP